MAQIAVGSLPYEICMMIFDCLPFDTVWQLQTSRVKLPKGLDDALACEDGRYHLLRRWHTHASEDSASTPLQRHSSTQELAQFEHAVSLRVRAQPLTYHPVVNITRALNKRETRLGDCILKGRHIAYRVNYQSTYRYLVIAQSLDSDAQIELQMPGAYGRPLFTLTETLFAAVTSYKCIQITRLPSTSEVASIEEIEWRQHRAIAIAGYKDTIAILYDRTSRSHEFIRLGVLIFNSNREEVVIEQPKQSAISYGEVRTMVLVPHGDDHILHVITSYVTKGEENHVLTITSRALHGETARYSEWTMVDERCPRNPGIPDMSASPTGFENTWHIKVQHHGEIEAHNFTINLQTHHCTNLDDHCHPSTAIWKGNEYVTKQRSIIEARRSHHLGVITHDCFQQGAAPIGLLVVNETFLVHFLDAVDDCRQYCVLCFDMNPIYRSLDQSCQWRPDRLADL